MGVYFLKAALRIQNVSSRDIFRYLVMVFFKIYMYRRLKIDNLHQNSYHFFFVLTNILLFIYSRAPGMVVMATRANDIATRCTMVS